MCTSGGDCLSYVHHHDSSLHHSHLLIRVGHIIYRNFCPSGSCLGVGGEVCTSTPQCSSGTCTANLCVATASMPCLNTTGCITNYWCDITNYYSGGHICQAGRAVTDVCFEQRGCASGLYCELPGSGTCKASVALGGACATNLQCASTKCDLASTFTCISNQCYNGVLDSGETAIDCGGATVWRSHRIFCFFSSLIHLCCDEYMMMGGIIVWCNMYSWTSMFS